MKKDYKKIAKMVISTEIEGLKKLHKSINNGREPDFDERVLNSN